MPSNSRRVLERFLSETGYEKLKLVMIYLQSERLTWPPEENIFTFKANAFESGFVLIKGKFLGTIASLFDPIEVATPFLSVEFPLTSVDCRTWLG